MVLRDLLSNTKEGKIVTAAEKTGVPGEKTAVRKGGIDIVLRYFLEFDTLLWS